MFGRERGERGEREGREGREREREMGRDHFLVFNLP
jgi:hypothetical protein